MTFKYFVGDEYHDDYFEYEVNEDRVYDAIARLMSEEFSITVSTASWMMVSLDLYEHLKEIYEDDLKELFEQEARDEWYEDYRDSHSIYE